MVDRRRQWRAENQNISIKRELTENIYIVNGHRGEDYRINLQKPHCECPDWEKRTPTGGCKHILKLKIEKNILDTLPSAKTDYFNSDVQSKTNYSSNWGSLSRRTKKRDQWTCQRCFAEGGPYSGVELNAHHIIPKSKGGKDTLDNLITLCKDCHENEHGHQISSTGGSSSQSDNYTRENKSTASSDIPSIDPDTGLRPNDRYGIREGNRIKKGRNNRTAEPNKSNYSSEHNKTAEPNKSNYNSEDNNEIQSDITNDDSGTATSTGSTDRTDNRTGDTTSNNELAAFAGTSLQCVNCGAKLTVQGYPCNNCRHDPDSTKKSPLIAVLLSVFIVGLGHLYLGKFLRGLGWFGAAIAVGIVVGVLLPLPIIVLTLITAIVSAIDSYKIATG